MFIFVPFSESIYSINLSVHLVHKLSTCWIDMHHCYCCCYFNSFTAHLLYIRIPSVCLCWRSKHKHTNHWLYTFFLRVFARKDAIICCCSLVVLLFSCLFIIYIYVQTIRVVTHPHLKFVWIFVVVSFFLLCCFLFFVFVFICSFDLILPHCIGSLFYWISNIILLSYI